MKNLNNAKILILRYINIFGLRTNLPFLSYFAINLSKFGSKNFFYKKQLKKKTIFVLFKSRGVNDIIESLKHKKIEYKIFFLDRIFFKDIFEFFFDISPSDLNIKKNNINSIKKIENNFKYKNYIRKINDYFEYNYKNIIFITFNFYFETLGLSIFRNKKKNKFYCLLKENNYSPAQKKIRFKNIKKFFSSLNFYDKITVYNDDVKKQMINYKLIDPKKIHTIGFPRIKKFQKKENIKKTILYFTIHPTAGIGGTNHKLNWNNLISKIEKFLVLYMQKNPEIKLIIKSKIGNYNKGLHEISKRYSNIEYFHTGDAQDFIPKADVVVGFNSTTIYESIYSNKNVLIPMLDLKKKNMKYVHEYPYDLICKTTGVFEKKLNIILKQNQKNHKKDLYKNIINKYLGDPKKAKKNLVKILND